MALLRQFIYGVTDDNLYKRIGWMYVSFFLLFMPVTALSYFLLPEAILRGKHPIISQLQLSSNMWVSTLQIFGYNLIPTALIIGSNLLAQQSRFARNRFVPIGYWAFWSLIIYCAVVMGTWSFEVVMTAPPLSYRLLGIFDITHRSGLIEFSAYILAATASFGLTRWYSDGKQIVASKQWRDVSISKHERMFLLFAFVLLLCAGLIESYRIMQVTSG